MNIERATTKDLWAVTKLALLLWPLNETQPLYDELLGHLKNDECALLVAKEDGHVIGFAECSIRHEYVEGASSSPVGYLEGIYVEESFRLRHVASALLKASERFAKEKGCAEFASDCVLQNTQSIAFHRGAGFSEANRIVCFIKKL